MHPIQKKTPTFISKQVHRGRYIFCDLLSRSGVDFSLACAGKEECANEYRIVRKGFRFFAVELVVAGEWNLELAGKNYRLGPGSAFAYGPDTSYALNTKSGGRFVKYFADFVGPHAGSLLKRARLDTRPISVVNAGWFFDVFDEILASAAHSKSVAQDLATLWARILLIKLGEEPRKGIGRKSTAYGSYIRCRRFLRENFLHIKSVNDAAQACHVAPAYLSRLFQKYSDEAPRTFLTRLKTGHAAILLQRSHCSVKEAAQHVGFDDPLHFSRVFKKHFGVAPSGFSNQNVFRLIRRRD